MSTSADLRENTPLPRVFSIHRHIRRGGIPVCASCFPLRSAPSPKLYRALKKNGMLDTALDGRVQQAMLVFHQCEVKGLTPDQARELACHDLFSEFYSQTFRT